MNIQDKSQRPQGLFSWFSLVHFYELYIHDSQEKDFEKQGLEI
jgi:hypothetical protein